LPGKPDLVFPRLKAVIFVHGCFWHQHDRSDCLDGRLPKSNSAYWVPKLARNVERDASNQRVLQERGWRVLTIWECETKDKGALAVLLDRFLRTTYQLTSQGGRS
jgi:DNA mismatch endonuclease (patch repair protein)